MIFAVQQWRDDAHGLGHDDQPHDAALLEAEAAGRLRLAVRHRLNTGPDGLGDKGPGINGQRERERDEFRYHADAALEAEAPEHRQIPIEGEARAEQRQQWQAE